MSAISKISPDGGTTEYNLRDNSANKYLTCSTGRSTAAKTITYSGFERFTGATVNIRFTDTGSSNPSSGNITLDINGTGAAAVVIGNSNKTVMTYTNGDTFYNNKCHTFVFDGTYWVLMGKDESSGGMSDLSGTDTGDKLLVQTSEI